MLFRVHWQVPRLRMGTGSLISSRWQHLRMSRLCGALNSTQAASSTQWDPIPRRFGSAATQRRWISGSRYCHVAISRSCLEVAGREEGQVFMLCIHVSLICGCHEEGTKSFYHSLNAFKCAASAIENLLSACDVAFKEKTRKFDLNAVLSACSLPWTWFAEKRISQVFRRDTKHQQNVF